MKRLLILVFLFICAKAEAQWLNGAGWLQNSNEFHSDGRAHPRERSSFKGTRIVPMGEPSSIPNWPFPNVNVTNFPDTDQTEPSIAINPLDSMNIVIAANDDRNFDRLWVYTSTDGGVTWNDQPLPKGADWVNDAFDPSVAFNASGTAFVMNGELDDLSRRNDIEVFRSTDKGANWERWGTPFIDSLDFDSIADKYYLTIDNSLNSPSPGAMYATWVVKGFSDTAEYVVRLRSTDEGKTWSDRTLLTWLGIYTDPIPAVEKHGELKACFVDHQIGNEQIFSDIQNDAGQPIVDYTDLGPVEPFDAFGNPTNNGYPVINGDVDGPLMVNSFPTIAGETVGILDRSFIAWCARGYGAPHMFLSQSDSLFPLWSDQRLIDNDTVSNAAARFFPWIATDPVTGNVGIVYYVVTLTPGMNPQLLADLYMAFSTDYGSTWATRRISDAPSFAAEGRDARFDTLKFFGDYINLAGYDNTWHPAWCDGRSAGDLEIYTATVQPFAPMPVTNLTAHDTIINGKHATVVSWNYDPQTTFGYPIEGGYRFQLAKDTTPIGFNPPSVLTYLDTSGNPGNEYKVTVVPVAASKYAFHSITDSVSTVKSGVSNIESTESSIRFTRMPLTAEIPTDMIIQSEGDCSIQIEFYDEAGNRVESAEDPNISNRHDFSIAFPTPGIRFYVVKEMFANEIKEIPGKIVIVP